jgi:hypothetical protein
MFSRLLLLSSRFSAASPNAFSVVSTVFKELKGQPLEPASHIPCLAASRAAPVGWPRRSHHWKPSQVSWVIVFGTAWLNKTEKTPDCWQRQAALKTSGRALHGYNALVQIMSSSVGWF